MLLLSMLNNTDTQLSRVNKMVLKYLSVTLISFFILFFLNSNDVLAGKMVSAQFTEISPHSLSIRLKLFPEPRRKTPKNIIISIFLPPHTKIKRSMPRFSRYDKKRGEVKWLVNQLKPGNQFFKLDFRPKGGREFKVRGNVSFRDPSTGRLITLPVSK